MDSPLALARLAVLWAFVLTVMVSVWVQHLGSSVADRLVTRAADTVTSVLQADALAVADRSVHGACPHVTADPDAWNSAVGAAIPAQGLAWRAAVTADSVTAASLRDNTRFLPRHDDPAVAGRPGFVQIASQECRVFFTVEIEPLGSTLPLLRATRTACVDFSHWPAERCGVEGIT